MDFGESVTGSDLEYYDGAKWVTYSDGDYVSLGSDGELEIRAAIVDDGVSDNDETFTLTAWNTGDRSDDGIGTIKDDGTGDYWISDATDPASDGDLNDAKIELDDDRPVSVNDVTVNEGSPNAVFLVTGAANQLVKLQLSTGGAKPASANGVDFGESVTGSDLEYYD